MNYHYVSVHLKYDVKIAKQNLSEEMQTLHFASFY